MRSWGLRGDWLLGSAPPSSLGKQGTRLASCHVGLYVWQLFSSFDVDDDEIVGNVRKMKGKGDNDDEGSCRGRDAKAKCLSQAKRTHDLTLHAKLSSYASEVTVEGSGLSTRWITFLRIFNQALGFFRQTTFRSARSLLWALVRFVLRAISLEPTTVTVAIYQYHSICTSGCCLVLSRAAVMQS